VGIEEGLRATVRWYLDNRDWCREVQDGNSRTFEKQWYGSRLDRDAKRADSQLDEDAHLVTDEISRDEIRERLDRSGALTQIGGPDSYDAVNTPIASVAPVSSADETSVSETATTSGED
jgi:hypothetical protein